MKIKSFVLLLFAFSWLLGAAQERVAEKTVKPVNKIREAVIVESNTVSVSADEKVFETKYQQNETNMAYKSQAKERALTDACHQFKTVGLVDPYVKVKAKKGFFHVTVKGYPIIIKSEKVKPSKLSKRRLEQESKPLKMEKVH